MPDRSTLDIANQAQREAANPAGSRLAAANAGSGKTRVLVSRVSRILLKGADPADILCLTYTRAAASEMQQRLFATLGKWSVLPSEGLRDELTELFGHPPENERPSVELDTARELFAKALETPEGLKVQTIHAFCERILSRFPVEAGILPGFEPLDDGEIAKIRHDVERQILIEAMENPQGDLAKAVEHLTLKMADQTLESLFSWMASAPHKIADWTRTDDDDLAKKLGLGSFRSVREIASEFWTGIDQSELDRAIEGLNSSKGKRDNERGRKLERAKHIADETERFLACHSIWLTKETAISKQLIAASTPDDAKVFLEREANRYLDLFNKYLGFTIFETTQAIKTIARRFQILYRETKHKARGLDYADQILFVKRLLQNSAAADWVRYKLDGGISHILLDEAQDTAPEQWSIINILADPFFQPNPDDDPNKPRTLFAVGDEKQSIYGFQGARPEQFLREIKDRSQQAVTDIHMSVSFRSTQSVLDVVDGFLQDAGGLLDMFDPELLSPEAGKIRHIANRVDKGVVELWPITPLPETIEDREPWDTRPVDFKGQRNQIEVLAKTIAREIKSWIETEQPIFDRDIGVTRPTRPEDILILVRRRKELFNATIRQLKRHDIPIAGADRLVLSETMIVKDLLSLARFCLLPHDDFSLAEVLKSPIIGYNDDALMSIAIGRDGFLFDALKVKDPDVASLLDSAIKMARHLTPYDFFAQFLDLKFRGHSIRKRFFKRLSMEAQDALEAFLHQALEHQTKMSPNLQRFLSNFTAREVQIKRELDHNVSEVRVMTVHGAKGLEAPIVILPETTLGGSDMDKLLSDGNGGYVWKPSKKTSVPYVEQLRAIADQRREQEDLRLLYVALTRAESKLIVCGHHIGRANEKLKTGCWYDWVSRAMDAVEAQTVQKNLNGESIEIQSYGGDPDPVSDRPYKSLASPIEIADWMLRPAPKEGKAARVTPSHLLSDPPLEMPVRSPGQTKNLSRFMRGNLTHKLLEVLPEVLPSERRKMAGRILSGYKAIPVEMGDDIIHEVFAVLDHPEFSKIFGPGSRAEVSLAGSAKTLPDRLYLNAQIDRLCVTDAEVFIVDYKSNRPPPTDPEDVSDLYLGQMAAYRELAREIYPKHEIYCALLWTDGPQLMVLPQALLDRALHKIAALPIS